MRDQGRHDDQRGRPRLRLPRSEGVQRLQDGRHGCGRPSRGRSRPPDGAVPLCGACGCRHGIQEGSQPLPSGPPVRCRTSHDPRAVGSDGMRPLRFRILRQVRQGRQDDVPRRDVQTPGHADPGLQLSRLPGHDPPGPEEDGQEQAHQADRGAQPLPDHPGARTRQEVPEGGQALGARRDQVQGPPRAARRPQEAEAVAGPHGALRPHQQGRRGVLHRTRDQGQARLPALCGEAQDPLHPRDEEGRRVPRHIREAVQQALRRGVRQGEVRRIHARGRIPVGTRSRRARRDVSSRAVAVPRHARQGDRRGVGGPHAGVPAQRVR